IVPEAGDEVQTMKAGLMEIADIFVVNKSDRPGADAYVKNLRQMLAPAFHSHNQEVPVLKTVAEEKKGLKELYNAISNHQQNSDNYEKRSWLLTERILQLVQKERMKNIDRLKLKLQVEAELKSGSFNLYRTATRYL
ncbi:MAG: methylmalonyl Co-A mutase-associated GTPase MeaB, partial [Flavisolibacter sp.]